MSSNKFFTRSKYDSCASNKTESENSHAFSIKTDKDTIINKRCYTPFVSSYNRAHGVPESFIDVSSDLRGQTRLLTKCPGPRYNPIKNCPDCKNCDEGMPCGCDHCKATNASFEQCESRDLITQYTRSKKSCNIFSGINIDRFDPHMRTVKLPDSVPIAGSNTRIQVKDQFKQLKSPGGVGDPVTCKQTFVRKRPFCQ